MSGYITIGILILMALVEITPIKINPISWLGKKLNKDILDKVENMRGEMRILKEKIDMNDIDALRKRILDDDTSIRKGEHFKSYQYKSIFKDIDKWKQYHNDYPELNGMIDVAIENIIETYKNEDFK